MAGKPAEPMERWPVFMEAIRLRLEAGRQNYGDRSFVESPVKLAGQVEEELLDVCGWSFIMWTRLQALQNNIPVNQQAIETSNQLAAGLSALARTLEGEQQEEAIRLKDMANVLADNLAGSSLHVCQCACKAGMPASQHERPKA